MIALLMAVTLALADSGEAEALYHAGRYEEASHQFQSLLSDPARPSGEILFNLGNCSFRLSRYADAVLFYRRALLRLPFDRELKFNLRLAERRLGLGDPTAESFAGAVETLVGSFRPRELLALVGLLQTVALLGLVFSRGRPVARRWFALLLLLALAGAARLVHDHWFAAPPQGVVLTGEIALRSEPHAAMPATFRLSAGETVRVVERSDRWIRVKHPRGRGWTERDGIGLVD